MKRSHKFTPTAVGGSALLAIFALLTLCVFALLSLATVLAEKRLSEAAAHSVESYYAAEYQAEEVFAQLKNGQIPESVTEKEGIWQYIVPISENQWLITEFEHTDDTWQILGRKTYARGDQPIDEHLPVWTGKTP